MDYTHLLQKLFRINLFGGVKLGLHNVERLQQLLHYPDRSFRSIHVAGTNGKGSVATKIAAACERSGYRTGLFTSPHIAYFGERIRINGQTITPSAVAALLAPLFALIDQASIPATFFEVTTLLAFQYFQKEEVEIAVIETGLGGRYDATNIIVPCLSVITSISWDHMEILGNTLEAIAGEKAGIIKKHVPVVIGPRVPIAPIQREAAAKHSRYVQTAGTYALFEEENQAIARTALELLVSRLNLTPAAIAEALLQRPPCRFEIVSGSPTIILDVAHNPDGLRHLFQMTCHYFPHHPLRILCGLSKSKDLPGCLSIIAAHAQHLHLVAAQNGRGAPTAQLRADLMALGIPSHSFSEHDSIAAAILEAKQAAWDHQQILVICGSFFIMAEARAALGYHEPRDPVDLNERYSP